jgi:hypothetical protein
MPKAIAGAAMLAGAGAQGWEGTAMVQGLRLPTPINWRECLLAEMNAMLTRDDLSIRHQLNIIQLRNDLKRRIESEAEAQA